MSKKILVIVIAIIVAVILLLTIYFQLQSVPLEKVSLTLKDINDEGYKDFKEFEHESIKQPYIASNETLFGGWKILEKYHVVYTNNSSFIVIDIGRLTSKDKCIEFISKVKNTTFEYVYTELKSETIGEGSYIGENISTITTTSGLKKVYLYFIVFRIDNVIVALVTSGFTKEPSINFAKIMESNLLSK